MSDEWPFQQGHCHRDYCFHKGVYLPFGSTPGVIFVYSRLPYTYADKSPLGWDASTLCWHSKEDRVCFL